MEILELFGIILVAIFVIAWIIISFIIKVLYAPVYFGIQKNPRGISRFRFFAEPIQIGEFS